MQTIDYYYDFGSPNCWVAHVILQGISERTGVSVNYKPILLGGLFKLTGNAPPMVAFKDVTGKTAYMQQQMARYLRRYNIPFNWNPHFPVMTTALMRGATFAQGKGFEADYIDQMMRAVWVEKLKMDDPDVIAKRLAESGLPVEELMAANGDDAIKKELFAATQAAMDRGAFGAPACFVGDERFFGKDALDDLEWYLSTL